MWVSCYSCSYRKSSPLLFSFLNYSEGIFFLKNISDFDITYCGFCIRIWIQAVSRPQITRRYLWSRICFFLTLVWVNLSDLIGKMRKMHLPYMSWRTVNFSFGYGYCSSSDSSTPTLCLAEFHAVFSDSTDAGIELLGDSEAMWPQSSGILSPRVSSTEKLPTQQSRNQADCLSQV